MAEHLGLPMDEIQVLRQQYYLTYGTTLRGLQTHHHVDAEDFLAYVHDLPLHQYLQPDPKVRDFLLGLPQRRWIFTNADSDHARRVLTQLGLVNCFDGIIDLRSVQFACKPELIAYQRALQLAGEPDPHACLMLDDAPANLATARQLGMTTVWVTRNGTHQTEAAYTISDILQLQRVMPELWRNHHE